MVTAVESLQSEFSSLVGASRAIFDPATCASFAVDGKVPKVVVYPPSAEHVAQVLRCAAERGLAVVPCRNATKSSIGNPPQRYDVALSLKEMNQVWHYEPADLTVGVEAGMKFADFQRFVGRHGLWLPLDPPAASRASLGGILATNSAGPLRLAFGAPRDVVLGMKIATTEGKVIKTGGRVVKNVAGYDLAKLLVGSYGTLGVIVEANLKLYPLPSRRATFVLRVGSLEAARNLRRAILSSPLTPMRMVLMNRLAAQLVGRDLSLRTAKDGVELWLEAGGSERVIERYARTLEEVGRRGAATTQMLHPDTAEPGWARITDFQSALAETHADLVVLKAALPLATVERFVAHAQQEAEKEKVRLAAFGQLGVGIVHLCLLETESAAPLVQRLRSEAEGQGGAMVLERASLEVKEQVEVWGSPGTDFEVMRKLKEAWDPKGVLAPGRFVGRL